ncbi:unnamed protein product [Phytophthora lilii]|uniref:Unnamed protein product n=1 Tax=Phytophthora lilii TaxID=2077276 RepID=A0A9W6X1H5_9STRA|nr:unnamed protein product [Phytophthora lilii]
MLGSPTWPPVPWIDFDAVARSRNPPPRVSLVKATLNDIIAELQVREAKGASNERSYPRQRDASDRSDDERSEELSDHTEHYEDFDNEYSSSDDERHLVAANDNERRAAAEGTMGLAQRVVVQTTLLTIALSAANCATSARCWKIVQLSRNSQPS